MKWYKHDSNANMDAKLQAVILEYGAEGYGLYWYCLELIASNVDADNLSFELEHDARIIARNLGMGVQRCEEMMKFMISLGLFEASNGVITCLKLAKRADDYTAKLVKSELSQAVDCLDLLESPTNSEKVQLDKKRIDKKKSRFTPPTVEEVQAYCRERNNTIDAGRFVDFYEAKGWMVGKNKMKSWQAAVRTWEQRNQSESSAPATTEHYL